MIWQTQRLSSPPPYQTVHFSEHGHGSAFHGFCGTFGYTLIKTDDPELVTCDRCKHKMREAA